MGYMGEMGPENNIELNSSHLKELFSLGISWMSGAQVIVAQRVVLVIFRNGPVDR